MDMMNKLLLCTILLCALTAFPSCGNKNKVVAGAPAVASKPFKPDMRFESIDSLVDCMIDGMYNETPDEFVQHYENRAAAIKSYWYLNHKGEDNSQMDETVCRDLEALADSLSGGSTYDMVLCGSIERAISRYLTAMEYCLNYKGNTLYQNEMRDWLLLEKELGSFYGELAYLANWGGSIARVIASGTLADLSKARQEDFSELYIDGYFSSSDMTIAEARANLIQELADAKSLDDEMADELYDGEAFREMLKEMRADADKVVVLLDRWLASRAKLCEAQGIPESHTAHFIAKLGQRIMELIEG